MLLVLNFDYFYLYYTTSQNTFKIAIVYNFLIQFSQFLFLIQIPTNEQEKSMARKSGWIRAKAKYRDSTRVLRVATIITGLSFQQLLHIL